MPQASFQAEEEVKRKKKKTKDLLLKKRLPPSRLMLQHSQQSNEHFECDQCDYKANSLNQLDNHKKS